MATRKKKPAPKPTPKPKPKPTPKPKPKPTPKPAAKPASRPNPKPTASSPPPRAASTNASGNTPRSSSSNDTQLDKWIDKINSTPGLSSAEKKELRQEARELANNNGNLTAKDRQKLASGISASKPNNSSSSGNTTKPKPTPGSAKNPKPITPLPNPPGKTPPGPGGRPPIQRPAPDDPAQGEQPPMPTDELPPGYRWEWNPDTGEWGFTQWPEDPRLEEEDPQEEDPVDEGPSADTLAGRANAREYLRGLFKQFGFTQGDIDGLMGQVEGWIQSGLADAGTDAVLMKFRDTDIYKRRFAGMAELIGRGQAISEAEYIQLESSYRSVMQNYGLPTTYYDNYDDYAKLIGAGLSVNEVEQRVVAAKQALNPLVAQELKQYYNIGDGDLTAYMLGLTDENGLALQSARNQEEIRQRGRAAQIGGAAERAGFSMDRTQAELLAGTSVGSTLDPFQMGTLASLESTFDQARRTANRETTLAGIDNEAYSEQDTLKAVFGDDQARLASERRAKRERSRFSGSSGVASSSLGVSRNL